MSNWIKLFVTKEDKRTNDRVTLKLVDPHGTSAVTFEIDSNQNETVIMLPVSSNPVLSSVMSPQSENVSDLIRPNKLKWEIRGRTGRYVTRGAISAASTASKVTNIESTPTYLTSGKHDNTALKTTEAITKSSRQKINCWAEQKLVHTGDGVFKIVRIVLKIEMAQGQQAEEAVEVTGCKFKVINDIYPESRIFSQLKTDGGNNSSQEFFIGGSLHTTKSCFIHNNQPPTEYHIFGITLKTAATLMLQGSVQLKGETDTVTVPLVTIS